MRRGEIYLVDLTNHVGSEQSGIRPALIVQNEKGNTYSATTIVCPLTSKQKPNLDTHFMLTPENSGVRMDSTLLCEQIRVVDKSRVHKKLGEVRPEIIEEINRRLMVSIGIE